MEEFAKNLSLPIIKVLYSDICKPILFLYAIYNTDSLGFAQGMKGVGLAQFEQT